MAAGEEGRGGKQESGWTDGLICVYYPLYYLSNMNLQRGVMISNNLESLQLPVSHTCFVGCELHHTSKLKKLLIPQKLPNTNLQTNLFLRK